MSTQYPDPPTYAVPFIEGPNGLEFNPVWLQWFYGLTAFITASGGGGGGAADHNSLAGLQGGTSGEYYHTTNAQYTELVGNKAAHTFYAGPASGGASSPAFRALVQGDIPAGAMGPPGIDGEDADEGFYVPGVTSLIVTGANGIGVSGSPITSSGTIELSLGDITPTSVSTDAVDTAQLNLTGNLSADGLFVSDSGIRVVSPASVFTSTGVGTSRTVVGAYGFDGGTWQADNATTIDDAATLYLAGAPTAGANVTLARRWALYFASSFSTYLAGGLTLGNTKTNVGTGGTLYITQSGSGQKIPIIVENLQTPAAGVGVEIDIQAGAPGAVVRQAALFTGFDGASNASAYLAFNTRGSGSFPERLRIASTGNVGIGNAGATTLGNSNRLQVAGTTAATNSLGISAWSADALGSRIELGKSRGAAIGTNTIVQDGDVVGLLLGYGANGSTFTNLASIGMEVDGTPGATNDMPGRIVFKTTPNGSGTLTEAMRLSQDQTALFASSVQTAAPTTGTAAPWKLGTLVTGQVGLTMLTTQYLEVDVSGSLIRLATI